MPSGKLRHDALYSWRTDGLLAGRSVRGVLDDGVSSGLREEAFAHDGLGRLTEAAASTGGAGRTLAYGYDDLGNLLSRTSTVAADVDVVEYDYGAGRNAVRHARIGDVRHQFAYDRSGRMTRGRQCRELSGRCTPRRRGEAVDDRHVEWDGRGLARRVLLGGGPSDPTPTARETFRHGPGGGLYERVSEWREDDVARSARTLQVGAYERTYPADPAVEHVERTRLPGGVVHVRTTPADGAATEAFEYRHVDHLGSTAAVSGAGAAPLAVLGHDPFGGRRRADWTRELTADESAALSGRRTARGFGGHEHLDRTGLVHMGGRLHDPRLGRFLSPDPYVADPASSQDWNAYSYVANSPLSHADPTGLFRAGPGCNVHGVMCLEADGGGFSPDAQAFEHRGVAQVVVPFVTVSWDWVPTVGATGGRDRPGVLGGHAVRAPRYTLGLLVRPLPYLLAGTLRVDGENPADEPMDKPGLLRGLGRGDLTAGQRATVARMRHTGEITSEEYWGAVDPPLDSTWDAVVMDPANWIPVRMAGAAVLKTVGASNAVVPTGQVHHVISTRIHRALEDHLTLRGIYRARDRRFESRAVDPSAHRGYQTWHRELDDDVVEWLTDPINRTATREGFEAYLRTLYSRPDLRARFPHGF